MNVHLCENASSIRANRENRVNRMSCEHFKFKDRYQRRGFNLYLPSRTNTVEIFTSSFLWIFNPNTADLID